jgi:tetratricopeptide (TPR) repeat protein
MPGRYDESLQQFDKAQELDPGSPSTLSDKGIILFNSGRVEEGIETLRDVERADPEFFSAHEYLMQIALERHDFRTFLSEGERAAEIRNDDVLRDVMAAARSGWATGGEHGLLENLYAKQKVYVAQGKVSPGPMALTCVAMGKRQEALDLLREAYLSHRPEGLWILSDPSLRTLGNEPGYKELVRRINFPGVSDGVAPVAPAAEAPLRAAK